MTQSIFDEQKFLQSLAGDRELAEELLGAFMDDCPARSTSLAQALESDDAGSAARLAHSLKGMCGVVRAEGLVTLALSMEHAAKNGDLDKTAALYAQFKTMLTLAQGEMQTFINA